jgi:nitrite reductase (NO-forming)
MSDQSHEGTEEGQTSEDLTQSVSRRAMLAGTAGMTIGGFLAAPAALAQQGRAAGPPVHHGHSGTMSDRIYSVNPSRPDMADIAENPANVPPPIYRTEPQTVEVNLETIEVEANLDTNSVYRFWTFNGTVPGPMVRVRVGDQVVVNIRNAEDSWYAHNVDFHAATGPGGGAELSTVAPGESASFRFKALNPGLYVYHCAVPPVAMHIANGMYGMILVEPEAGLQPVDREFYVMQGEIYTEEPIGTSGTLTESWQKLIDERAEYIVFNGHVGALTEHYPLRAQVGETVRIYFGVGGPNYMSSFHVIGEIFDRIYPEGSLASPPIESVQTIKVAPGGSGIVEFKCEVPGRFVLVDHALSRVERGLAGYLIVEGEENPEIFTQLQEPTDQVLEDVAPEGSASGGG